MNRKRFDDGRGLKSRGRYLFFDSSVYPGGEVSADVARYDDFKRWIQCVRRSVSSRHYAGGGSYGDADLQWLNHRLGARNDGGAADAPTAAKMYLRGG